MNKLVLAQQAFGPVLKAIGLKALFTALQCGVLGLVVYLIFNLFKPGFLKLVPTVLTFEAIGFAILAVTSLVVLGFVTAAYAKLLKQTVTLEGLKVS